MAELRIVAGEWRGRKIRVPGAGVRPTADRVRESWMSIVRSSLDDARVLDLYAGSGALGLEALSRGAVHCDFVEQDAKVLRVLEENIAVLGATARATVHRRDAVEFVEAFLPPTSPLPSAVWNVAFADPPYHEGIATALAECWLRTPFATIFGIEHEAGLTLPDAGSNQRADRRVYGDTAITLYGCES